MHIRHYSKKLLKITDPLWDFYIFTKKIHFETLNRQKEILKWSEKCIEDNNGPETFNLNEYAHNPIVSQGFKLRKLLQDHFKNKLDGTSKFRILIHIPNWRKSPGGFSAYTNLHTALKFIGIPTKALMWHDDTYQALKNFKPNLLLTCDHKIYLDKINWHAVSEYRRRSEFYIGLNAQREKDENTPLNERIKWAKINGVNFYFSFCSPEYLEQTSDFFIIRDAKYSILSIEFGANPIIFYPVPNITKDLNYVFLGSYNPPKFYRYFKFFNLIFQNHPGFIYGPGWPGEEKNNFLLDQIRYIYARGRIGLNLHVDEQIQSPNELNERTYNLAASGVPQLIDNPKLLGLRFKSDGFFIGNTPEEYYEKFRIMLENPKQAEQRALIAQNEVFQKHTIYHRAEKFIIDLDNLLLN